MDYFTKYVKAITDQSINQETIIKFIKEQIIHMFGLLESITTNKKSIFTREDMNQFTQEYGFKIVHSTPYYIQVNR